MFHIYDTKRTKAQHEVKNLAFDEKSYMEMAIKTLKKLYPYNPTRSEFIDTLDPIVPSNYDSSWIAALIGNVLTRLPDNKYHCELIRYDTHARVNEGLHDKDRFSYVKHIENYKSTAILNRLKVRIITYIRYLLSFDEASHMVTSDIFKHAIDENMISKVLPEKEYEKLYQQALDELANEGWFQFTGEGKQIELIP